MGCVSSKEGSYQKAAPKEELPPAQSEVHKAAEPKAAESDSHRPSPNGAVQGNGSVEEKYDLGKELGRGGFSIVREAVNKATKEKVAVKFIEKKFVDQDELKLLQREIDIMARVQHKNVLRLFEIFDTAQQLSLVMELVNGGELFYKIVDKGSYSELEARDIVRQLVEGVDYLHNQGIAHRDLKPENLLCSEMDDGKMVIKIADFGLSKTFSGESALETSCGTPDYAAPEVLRMDGAYDKSVDLWSIGVITYVLLCGFPPFYGKSQAQLFEKILNADFEFPEPEWTQISAEAKDFINHLLVLDVKQRYNTKQCLEHPWLKALSTGNATNINVTSRPYMTDYIRTRENRPGVN